MPLRSPADNCAAYPRSARRSEPWSSSTWFARALDGFSVSEAGVSLGFADGEQAGADVLIGADGIHSISWSPLPSSWSIAAARAFVCSADGLSAPWTIP
jgi:2-polyprenyl-6-methoxyphenol hydroxylase-like FAD-dependent oxidoreductase